MSELGVHQGGSEGSAGSAARAAAACAAAADGASAEAPASRPRRAVTTSGEGRERHTHARRAGAPPAARVCFRGGEGLCRKNAPENNSTISPSCSSRMRRLPKPCASSGGTAGHWAPPPPAPASRRRSWTLRSSQSRSLPARWGATAARKAAEASCASPGRCWEGGRRAPRALEKASKTWRRGWAGRGEGSAGRRVEVAGGRKGLGKPPPLTKFWAQ